MEREREREREGERDRRLFKLCRNVPARHCVAGVQAVRLSNIGTYLPGTMLQGCRLYKRCQNLPAGHCYSDAGCLRSIRTYLPGTVLQGCRLFKQCWSLPAVHCVAGVQTVSAMSEPTCLALCCSGAGCLSSV